MHSAIGTELKRMGKTPRPVDWKQIGHTSRRKGYKPYLVHDLNRVEIKDFKSFVKENLTLRKKGEDEMLNAFY